MLMKRDIESIVDHEIFRNSVREFAQREVEIGAAMRDRNHAFYPRLFRRLAEQNWFGVTTPTEFGGQSADPLSTIIVIEELSRSDPALALSYLAQEIIFVHNLAMYGNESQKIKYLSRVINGEWRAGGVMTTPEAGTYVQTMKSRAHKIEYPLPDFGWKITGKYSTITNYDGDVLLVYSKTSDSRDDMSLFIVERTFPGFSIGKREDRKLGMRASPTGEINLDECEVPYGNIVGEQGRAFPSMMRNLEFERLGLAAISLGAAERALYDAIDYASLRMMDGDRLLDKDITREKIGQSAAEIEVVRTAMYDVARRINKDARNSLGANSVKLMAERVGVEVTDRALQLMGGAGYCGSGTPERMYRDARLIKIGGGTTETEQLSVANELIARLGYKKK